MGAVGAVRDVIVVGLGPGGAATSAMASAPRAFGIAGSPLDVLALEARHAPTRARHVGVQPPGQLLLDRADDLLARAGLVRERTAPVGVASIRRIEETLREALEVAGGEARYGARIVDHVDLGHGGVRVHLSDGSVERARFLVDGSGGRMGAFAPGHAQGETVYLTGQLPPRDVPYGLVLGTRPVRVHGAGNDRTTSPAFAFSDAREGATAFIEYPSMPARALDAGRAHRLLRRQLEAAGIDPRGLRDAAFIRTPHVPSSTGVAGSVLAVGDTVRKVSPTTALGVSNALEDAASAARTLQDILRNGVPRERALAAYARDVTSR